MISRELTKRTPRALEAMRRALPYVRRFAHQAAPIRAATQLPENAENRMAL